MKKFTLYVGLNDKDSKVQEIATLEAVKIINNVCMAHADGATIFEADGIYRHEDGTFVVEKTIRVELMFVDVNTVHTIVDILKTTLNQESIAVQTQEIVSELW